MCHGLKKDEKLFLNLSSILFYFKVLPSILSVGNNTYTEEETQCIFYKELKVAGESWPPFWVIYCPDGTEKQTQTDCATVGDMSYGGVMWELLLLMQRTKNVTFTHMIPPVPSWGNCYSKNNCTGMIGMVNRGEVDFAIGFDRYIYSNVKYQFNIMI